MILSKVKKNSSLLNWRKSRDCYKLYSKQDQNSSQTHFTPLEYSNDDDKTSDTLLAHLGMHQRYVKNVIFTITTINLTLIFVEDALFHGNQDIGVIHETCKIRSLKESERVKARYILCLTWCKQWKHNVMMIMTLQILSMTFPQKLLHI